MAVLNVKPPFPAASEAELVARCRAGDAKAWKALYQTHQARVHNRVVRMAGSENADDLTHDVFLNAFRNIDRFRGEARIGTWLFRLATNTALAHIRDHGKHDQKRVPWERLDSLEAPEVSLGDPRLRERLTRALASLPPGYRSVLVYHDVLGLRHEEIATELGCAAGTSKSQLNKARARMRELLGPDFAESLSAV